MLVLVSVLGAQFAGNDPGSTAARVLGVLPPFSALVPPVRIVTGRAPCWEPPLAVGLVLLAVAGLDVLAARVSEGSVLRRGGTVPWRGAWRSRSPDRAVTADGDVRSSG